jgi:hypothetical protein
VHVFAPLDKGRQGPSSQEMILAGPTFRAEVTASCLPGLTPNPTWGCDPALMLSFKVTSAPCSLALINISGEALRKAAIADASICHQRLPTRY